MGDIKDYCPWGNLKTFASVDQVRAGLGVGIRENPAADPDMFLEFFADRSEHRMIVRDRMDDIDDFNDFPEVSGGKSHGGCFPFVGANNGGCDVEIPQKRPVQ